MLWCLLNIEIQTADTFTALFLVGVALAAIAGALLSKPKNENKFDDSQPLLVEAGSALKYVIGLHPVKGAPIWAGFRQVKEEKVKSGGKGFGGSSQKTSVYYETACHALALGPITTLHRIYSGNDILFQGPIHASEAPSGTKLYDKDGNPFIIYWGEKTQPIDTELEKALGVASRWPYIAKVVWLNRKLGNSPTWPDMDYDIEAECIAKIPLPGSNCSIPETNETQGSGSTFVAGSYDQGANGAHIIYQLLTGKYPHGMGLDTSYINSTMLIALGQKLEAEKLAQSLLILDFTTVANLLGAVLADASCMVVEDLGQLAFIPLRANDPKLEMTDNVLVFPAPRLDVSHGGLNDDAIYFTYLDSLEFFTQKDIPLKDESMARIRGRKQIRTIPLETVTNPRVAVLVAEKQKQIGLADQSSVEATCNKTARKLRPAQIITVANVGDIRISSIEINLDSPQVRVSGILNQYWLDSTWTPVLPDPSTQGELEKDTFVRLVELPRDFSGKEIWIAPLRGREDGQAISASVFWSSNGTNYTGLGTIGNVVALGKLTEDINHFPESNKPFRRVLDYSPKAIINDNNITKLLDLSSDTIAWKADKQIVLIGEEILSLQSVSADTGDYYFLNNLVRGQLYTSPQQHESSGDPYILIAAADSLGALSDPSWIPGQKIYLKIVPVGFSAADISPIEYIIKGKALGPLPVNNIKPYKYELGIDLDITWGFALNKGTGLGAGELVAGAALPSTTPAPEGDFLVEILDTLSNVVRSEVVTGLTYTYTYADRDADAMEGSVVVVRITNKSNGVGGYPVTKKIYPGV